MLALVRDPLLSRVDRRLAAILGGSIALHIAIAAYAWSADLEEPEEHVAASAIPVEYQEIDILIPDFTKPETVTNAPGAATPVAPNQTPKPIVRPTIRPQITTSPQIDPNNLGGFFADDGPSRRPTLDLASQIREAREGHVEIGPDRTPPDDRPRLGTTPDFPITDNPELTHVDPTHHEGLPARIIPGPVQPQTATTLTPALVLQIIQDQYMRGLQRCYSRGLASEGASLSGKVALAFTVGPTGQLTEHSASGVSAGVASCIDGQMSTWRFPVPRDVNGNAKDAPFTVTLALQPS